MFGFKRKKQAQLARAEALREQLSRMEGIEASPKNVRHHLAHLNRLRKRRESNWNSFRYKFTLTPEQEQKARTYCEENGFDFEAEWRCFNDNSEVSQAATLQQREAEKKWFADRCLPNEAYRCFLDKMEAAIIVYRVLNHDPKENNPYMSGPERNAARK